MEIPANTLQHTPDRNVRRAAVGEAASHTDLGSYSVLGPEGYIELPVAMLDPRYLVYRADNGRIISELTDYAASRNETLQELRQNAERPDVQQAIHDLLLEKARDPDGPIYAELERHGRQTEPLLIDRDGVVLNGNRRLAAMRELAAEDAGIFESVRVAVLPEAIDAATVEFIEAGLQMAPDLKLEYSWVNRRLKLRQHAEDLDPQAIVEAYRFPDHAEIDKELAELALAEDYLEWIGQPGHYSLLADDTEAFESLNRNLATLGPGPLFRIWRLIGFALISARETIDRPIAHLYPFADPVPPAARQWIPRTLAEDHGLVERQAPGQNKALDERAAVRVCAIVDDPSSAAETARTVIALGDMLKADQDKLIGSTRIVGQLRKARQTLEQLDPDSISSEQQRQMRAEVAALSALLQSEATGVRLTTFPAWDRLKARVRREIARR